MTLFTENEIEEQVVWEGTIGEMGPTAGADLEVPADFMKIVTDSDSDPMFVTVDVESGMSKSKRNWKPEHLQAVVNKVNKDRMAGNLGHPLLDPKAHERDFPIPQVAWVVAKSTQVGGKMTARFKGYVLKTAQARELLKLGLIDGVSIFGDSRMKPIQGGYEVISFSPETIDFARKGRAGMTSRIVGLTGEQTSKGGNVEPKDIAALSPDEIKTHAPLVYDKIQADAVAPLNVKVGEMETAIKGLQPDVDVLGEIKKLLKLEDGENPVEKLTNFIKRVEDVGSESVRNFVHELAGKKVKTERGQALLKRLIGEQESSGWAFSSQYDGALTDDLKTKITEDFTKVIDADDQVKELVGEMISNDDDKGKSNGQGGSGLGGRSRAGNDAGRNDKSEKRGGLTITKRKFSDVS